MINTALNYAKSFIPAACKGVQHVANMHTLMSQPKTLTKFIQPHSIDSNIKLSARNLSMLKVSDTSHSEKSEQFNEQSEKPQWVKMLNSVVLGMALFQIAEGICQGFYWRKKFKEEEQDLKKQASHEHCPDQAYSPHYDGPNGPQ
jgi:uncharacterized membrane protein YcgQ (UPF0703/DUF1980 family)